MECTREESKDDGVMTLQDHTNDGSHKEVAVEVELSIAACLDDTHDMLIHRLSLTSAKDVKEKVAYLSLKHVMGNVMQCHEVKLV